jgi:hypothetical protein
MLGRLYSLPQQRLLTPAEFRTGYQRARRNVHSYFEWLVTTLPIEGDPIDADIVRAGTATVFTLPPDEICPDSSGLVSDRLADEMDCPAHIHCLQARARAAVIDLAGQRDITTAFIFQRGLNARAADTLGGQLHNDDTIHHAWKVGKLNVFANLVGPEVPTDATPYGLRIANLSGMDYGEYHDVEQVLLDANDFGQVDVIAAFDRRFAARGWYVLCPNRWHLIVDAMPHKAGTVPAAPAAPNVAHGRVTTINLQHHKSE